MLRFLTAFLLLFASLSAYAADPKYVNSVGMEFVLVPAGSHIMGSSQIDCSWCPDDDPFTEVDEHQKCVELCYNIFNIDEYPPVKINITQPFYIGKYEVTQGQWYKVMGNDPASHKNFDGNGKLTAEQIKMLPIENVSYDDVQQFIYKLNQMEGGNYYALPTEAQWDYAAAGGEHHVYSGSDYAHAVAWFAEDANSTHTVGTKKPNGYGIYDMSGNVAEWCMDGYYKFAYAAIKNNYTSSNDPFNPISNEDNKHVVRGGAFSDRSEDIRVEGRGLYNNVQSGMIGFRLIRFVSANSQIYNGK